MPRHPFFEKETKAGLFQPRIKFLETFSREAPNLFEYRVPRLTALDGTEGKASTGERPSRRREPAELSALDARMEAAALAFASDHTVQGLHILQSAVEPILSSSVSVEPSFRDSVLAAVTGLGQVSLDAEALGVRWQMSSGRNRAPWRASAHIMEAVAGILYAASLASPDPATVSDSLLTTGDDLQDVAQLLRFSILATPEWSAGRTLMPWRMFLAPAKPPEEESISAIVWMHQRSAEFMRRRREFRGEPQLPRRVAVIDWALLLLHLAAVRQAYDNWYGLVRDRMDSGTAATALLDFYFALAVEITQNERNNEPPLRAARA